MGKISRNRGILSLVILLLLMSYGVVSEAGTKETKPSKAPAMVISQPTFEAGKVLEGDEVVHTFVIQNKGNADLIIKSVKPG